MVDIESTTPHASTLPASSLCSIDISLEDTFLALSSCDPSKAMGGDGIPPMILKHAASALAEPVHHLFYLCHSPQIDSFHLHVASLLSLHLSD